MRTMITALAMLAARVPGAALAGAQTHPRTAVSTKTVPHIAAAVSPAAATFPPVTYSRYVSNTNMYTMGCNQGKASDAQGQHNQLALFSFGDPGPNGAGTFGAWDSYIGGFNSIAAIQADVETYMQGFWDCTVAGSKSYLNVAPGVTNNGSGINSSRDTALGTARGTMVKNLGARITSKGYTAQLGALGSADFEPGYGTPSHALNRATGFQSTGSYYYDFGSADGCPPHGSCDNGWTQTTEYQLAWGNAHAFAAPQIYNAAMAQEWASISSWGRRARLGRGDLLLPRALPVPGLRRPGLVAPRDRLHPAAVVAGAVLGHRPGAAVRDRDVLPVELVDSSGWGNSSS